jgi:hypothetical protein
MRSSAARFELLVIKLTPRCLIQKGTNADVVSVRAFLNSQCALTKNSRSVFTLLIVTQMAETLGSVSRRRVERVARRVAQNTTILKILTW